MSEPVLPAFQELVRAVTAVVDACEHIVAAAAQTVLDTDHQGRYREDPLLALKRERLEQINAEDGALIDRIRRS